MDDNLALISRHQGMTCPIYGGQTRFKLVGLYTNASNRGANDAEGILALPRIGT